MNQTVYSLFASIMLLSGCAHPRADLCENVPAIRAEIALRRLELSESKGRSPASVGRRTPDWTVRLVRRIQSARDGFEAERSDPHASGAYRALTDAADATTYLVGYLVAGRSRESLKKLDEVRARLDDAVASAGCRDE